MEPILLLAKLTCPWKMLGNDKKGCVLYQVHRGQGSFNHSKSRLQIHETMKTWYTWVMTPLIIVKIADIVFIQCCTETRWTNIKHTWRKVFRPRGGFSFFKSSSFKDTEDGILFPQPDRTRELFLQPENYPFEMFET